MEKLRAAIDALNPAQKEAVLHEHCTDNELLVLAGAGSGKTHVLTLRIARLVFEGCPPEKIICVTFTVAAAEEMRERLALWLGKERAAAITACTFHSLAWKMVGGSPPQKPETVGWKLLGYPERPAILDESELSDSKKKSPVDSAPNEAPPSDNSSPARAAIALDELIPAALRLIETSSEALDGWGDSFRFLLVDEFQDIDPLQYTFCRTLLRDSKNFFAVGDDDQAIYGFRGADPSCILRFLENHPTARMVKLELNYRSHPEILLLANQIFAKKDPLLRKVLRAPEKPDAPPATSDSPRVNRLQFRTGWEEMEKIAIMLHRFHDDGRAWNRMALLSRTNRLCDTLRRGLTHFRIPEEMVVQTIHASKGLEYEVVFLMGLSDELFPLKGADAEEERRLFYVGVTRARERLFLSHAACRSWRGKRQEFAPSLFLKYHREGIAVRLWRAVGLSEQSI